MDHHTAPDAATASSVTATARNASGTVWVRCTDGGIPVDLRIDPQELRFGAAQLAETIVALTRRAALEAAVLRREQLTQQGVPRATLDRMGMPTRDDLPRVDDTEPSFAAPVPPPVTWLRRA
ncbi:MAG: hypothetical protein GXY65_11425 [Rhodococcus sp.]|uniref:hypothetical protein n=1 Tax=Rhodococcus TaxID=1827 RepID=UPI0016A3C046|nr:MULTISPECIES: hypothetical protein [Rhodococcus]NLV79929.1 hypothetical protein [Rhodococcus sp. (in: high G+C Gram-positive bacteria)]